MPRAPAVPRRATAGTGLESARATAALVELVLGFTMELDLDRGPFPIDHCNRWQSPSPAGENMTRMYQRLLGVGAAVVVAVGVFNGPASAQGAVDKLFAESAAASLKVGDLPDSNLTIKSAISVDLQRDFATLPLHRATVSGVPVWYVITDVSDAALARELGLNFAPRLANLITPECPGCVQTVQSPRRLGKTAISRPGKPDFSPTRVLEPGPKGFPPLAARPGADGDLHYSPFVRIAGTDVVYNAPIVAVGSGRFDVTNHTNTHDRLLSIDTEKMTAGLAFIRGFSNGKPIFYLSFETSSPLTAVIERSTFVPGLGLSPAPDHGRDPKTARADIFTFTNAATGPKSPPAQGLTHVIVDGGNAQTLNLGNTALLEALRVGGDAHNVFDVFPTLKDQRLALAYSPLWDLHIGVFSDAAVAAGVNSAKTESAQILDLAARGMVTSPGGGMLASNREIINCPALGFPEDAPQQFASGSAGPAPTNSSAPAGGPTPTVVPAGSGGLGATTSTTTRGYELTLGFVGLALLGFGLSTIARRRRRLP